jgi:hypothetical protein
MQQRIAELRNNPAPGVSFVGYRNRPGEKNIQRLFMLSG